MSEKIAVLMEFKGFENEELKEYLSLKFGSMPKGGLTASFLSEKGYKKAKSIILTESPLNENQQVVMEKLKKNIVWGCDNPFVAIYNFIQRRECPNILLTYKEETQVLAAFSEWAQNQDEE